MSMNPEVKAKWVAALRSGEYKQGAAQLRDEHTGQFCCLGVLCDLFTRDGNAEWDGDVLLGYSGDLPQKVCLWAGLPESDPKVSVGGQLRHITGHNDGLFETTQKTFAQIADAIEAQL